MWSKKKCPRKPKGNKIMPKRIYVYQLWWRYLSRGMQSWVSPWHLCGFHLVSAASLWHSSPSQTEHICLASSRQGCHQPSALEATPVYWEDSRSDISQYTLARSVHRFSHHQLSEYPRPFWLGEEGSGVQTTGSHNDLQCVSWGVGESGNEGKDFLLGGGWSNSMVWWSYPRQQGHLSVCRFTDLECRPNLIIRKIDIESCRQFRGT